jgi:predicted ATPase
VIKTSDITNYKSVDKLEFELGRVNVFIGENGCGKTNILEAIALAAASAAGKRENEFLLSRGIRATEPVKMRSGFTSATATSPVYVTVRRDSQRVFSAQSAA